MTEAMLLVQQDVADEAERAARRYGSYNSTHEALGVLLEELAELMEAIRKNDLSAVRKESIQVSAVAARLAAQCEGDGAFRERSVK